MKVFDIIVESNFKVVKAKDGFNILGPDGNVVGTEKIAGAARSKAAELNKAPNIKPGLKGQISLEIDGKTFSGTPEDVIKELEAAKLKPKGTLAKIASKSKSLTSKTVKFILSTKFFAFVGAAQLIPVVSTYHSQKEALTEIWKIYPKGHPYALGSPRAQEMIDKTLQPYLHSMYTAMGAIAVDVLLSIVKGGKATRILQSMYGAMPPATPWTAVLKVILFAATEGALFALTWAIQKYGPDFFTAMANEKLSEYFSSSDDTLVSVEAPKAPSVNKTEVFNKIKSEKEKTQPKDTNGATPTEPSGKKLKYDFGH